MASGRLSIPPPARVAIGNALVGGQNVELYLTPEWARYFESLNTQVVVTSDAVGLPGAPGTTGAAGVGVSLSEAGESSVEFIPVKGDVGPRGDSAALFMLQSEEGQADVLPMIPSQPDERFIAPTLLNSWVDFDPTTYNATGYWRDKAGVVHLRGELKSGVVGVTIFTLPTGYRPFRREVFAVCSNSAFGRVDVDVTGDVIVVAGSNTSLSLDGITFRATETY